MRLSDGCDDEETPDVSDGIGLAEALLGLDGFRILEVTETADELVSARSSTNLLGTEPVGAGNSTGHPEQALRATRSAAGMRTESARACDVLLARGYLTGMRAVDALMHGGALEAVIQRS